MKKILLILICILILVFGFINIRLWVLKKIYPLEFKDQIEEYSKLYNVDPYLVSSVIWVESKFEKSVISEKGAIGLMQIMPDTGEWIADKVDFEEYEQSKLDHPDVNIRFGCWYLRYLDDRFGGKTNNILAAYNAGPNRVAEWIEDERYSINRELVNIPIKETKDYVKRVNDAYEVYKFCYVFE